MVSTQTAPTAYTLQQAEQDIAALRGQVATLTEILQFTNSTQAPNVPTVGPVLYGLAGMMKFLSSADNQAYNTGRQTVWCTANKTISSTAQSAITGMTINVAPGTYTFHATVAFTATSTGNDTYLTMGGTATASTFFASIDGQAYATGVNPFQTTLGNNTGLNSNTVTNGNNYTTNLYGLIVVSAAGTFVVNGASSANASTFTVQAGSGPFDVYAIS